MIPIYTVKLRRNGGLFIKNKIMYQCDASSVLPVLRIFLRGAVTEHHVVMLLNKAGRVTGIVTTATGTLTSVSISPRQVLLPAILHNAEAIIACHNHPSGDPTPSTADRDFHKQLETVAEALGVCLLDDIIIAGPREYFSFSEERNKESRQKLKGKREKAVLAAKRRLQNGTATRRDIVLLAAERLAEVPSMAREEVDMFLREVIHELTVIAETPDRIRRQTRQRAKELRLLAIDTMRNGVSACLSRLFSIRLLDDPPPKKTQVPIVDFINVS